LPAGVITLKVSIDKGRMDSPRGDAIAANVFVHEVLGHRERHGANRSFAHGVSKAVRKADDRYRRRKIEDDTAALRHHGREGSLHAQVHALDIDPEDAIEIRNGGCRDGAYVGNAGAVDENVDPTVSGDGCEYAADTSRIGHVALLRLGHSACMGYLTGSCLGSRGVDIQYTNFRTVSS